MKYRLSSFHVGLVTAARAAAKYLHLGGRTLSAALRRSATALFGALPLPITDRMVKTARKKLPGWPEDAFAVRELPVDRGPGIVLLLEAAFFHDHQTEPA